MEKTELNNGINSINDLQEGMILNAIINNTTSFGAFANIGIEQDGLIHISQLADRFVSDPKDVVRKGQEVTVKVLEVDRKSNRISLSMKDLEEQN